MRCSLPLRNGIPAPDHNVIHDTPTRHDVEEPGTAAPVLLRYALLPNLERRGLGAMLTATSRTTQIEQLGQNHFRVPPSPSPTLVPRPWSWGSELQPAVTSDNEGAHC